MLALPAQVADPPPYTDTFPNPLDIGLIGAVVIAALFGARRALPLDNPWQVGVIAVLAAFGALLFGFLGAPVYHLLGTVGLILWAALGLALGLAAGRWSARGSRGETLSPAEREALEQEPREPRR